MIFEGWLTNGDLEAAQALADAATPGPWVLGGLDRDGNRYIGNVIDDGALDAVVATSGDCDAAFIAATRTLIPALLHRIRFQHDKAIRAQEFWEGKIRGLQRDVDQYRFMHSSRCAEVERANARADKTEALLEEIRALVAADALVPSSNTHYELRALLERNHS